MQQPVAASDTRSINPHHFGPLDDQSRPGHVPGTLFSGVERFLGKGEIRRRAALWEALAERLERVCAADEQVLYVEANHDTLLVLSSGDRLRILESPEEYVERVAAWRQRTMGLSFLNEIEPDPA